MNLDDMSSAIDALQSQCNMLLADVVLIKAKFDPSFDPAAILRDVDDLKSSTSEAKSSLDDLKSTLADLKTTVDELKSTVDELKSKISG